ncbi:MAG TPA: NADH-quinone oxidoreductase subunit N, partial [Solirubrobacterales bacterium]|nr:NADH-quinone oxidoreductase subunit N [Solirubrobacterales bacterium]
MIQTPDIDYLGLAPILALTAGLCLTLLGSVFADGRRLPTLLAIATLLVAGGFSIALWGEPRELLSDTLRIDEFAVAIGLLAIGSAVVAMLLSIGEPAAEEAGRGEYHVLLLGSVLGMVVLAQSQNLLTLFLGIELLSIPLYALCATNLRRASSLESGLKYLIVGSLGSAALLYGLALIYGASGATDFGEIATAIAAGELVSDSLLLVGIALVATGLAFKVSIAPFHQWTPDVYQGAPTPITAFMAVATKAAALAAFVRLFLVALEPSLEHWDIALAALAAVTIIVGNVGALGQDSLKRMLGYSGVAQAGYLLGGLVVASEAGVAAIVFYLAAYTFANLAAFAVIVARERETHFGDEIRAVEGIGVRRPALAWPLTIAMLALAGLPGTAGFIGKLFLIEALVAGEFTWLAVMIAIGTMISLAYYLRVVAAVWMRPVPAGAGPGPGLAPAAAPMPIAGAGGHGA